MLLGVAAWGDRREIFVFALGVPPDVPDAHERDHIHTPYSANPLTSKQWGCVLLGLVHRLGSADFGGVISLHALGMSSSHRHAWMIFTLLALLCLECAAWRSFVPWDTRHWCEQIASPRWCVSVAAVRPRGRAFLQHLPVHFIQ